MKLEAKVNFNRFEEALQVVDAHTAGEFCRMVIGGFPEPEGSTMIEKKKWMEEKYDHVRTALMLEPRGHHDMFGAFLCEPIHEEADLGVIFMDTGGYLNMCGHCTIGAVTVALEAGLVECHEGEKEVVLDAPAGIIRTKAEVKNGKVLNVTLTNVPAFLYKENLTTEVDGREVHYDISFGGSFFALVDIEQFGWHVDPQSIPQLTDFGMKLIEKVNAEVEIRHPELDITTVDLAELYCSTDTPGCDKRNVVIFGDHMADRSPCGTGTSAKLATLYKKGEIKVGQPFVYESFIGSQFKGVILDTTKVADYDAVIPQITGSAYLTGEATYVIDPDDPLKYGFKVGR